MVSSVKFSSKHNLLHFTLSRDNSEDILIHSTSKNIRDLLVSISRLSYNKLYRSIEGSLILIVARLEENVNREPNILNFTLISSSSNRAIRTNETISIRHNITLSNVHLLNLNSRDMSLNAQSIKLSTTTKSKNISLTNLRKGKLNVINRVRSINCRSHLVLISEHINLITLSINKNSLLHAHGELRTLSNNLLNSTLIEDHVHKNILVNREGHTDNRVIVSHISMLENCINIVLKLLFHHSILVFNITRIIHKRIISILIHEIAAEELLKSLLCCRTTKNSLGLLKNIHTRLIEQVLSKLSKRLNIVSHRILGVRTTNKTRLGRKLTNRHNLILLVNIITRMKDV